jgi:hypothetical protein
MNQRAVSFEARGEDVAGRVRVEGEQLGLASLGLEKRHKPRCAEMTGWRAARYYLHKVINAAVVLKLRSPLPLLLAQVVPASCVYVGFHMPDLRFLVEFPSSILQ